MSISSDEINFLVYRYLQENGFLHSAFTFAYESLVVKSSTAQTEIPPGALITFLQKGLEYIAIEEHINEDGSIQDFENNFSLLSPVICESLAAKDDRRVRRVIPAPKPPVGKSESGASVGAESDAAAGVQTETSEANNATAASAAAAQKASQLIKVEDNGTKYLQLHGHQGEVFMCLWNPVQRQLASGSADGMCRLWGLWDMTKEKWASKETTVSLQTAIMPHTMNEGEKYKDVTSVTWSPDGKLLATGCYDGMARIWNSRGKLVSLLKEHTGPVFSLKWNKSGQYLLSGSYDRRAIVWSVETGIMLRSFMLHSGPVLDVDWRDGDVFATCSSDRCIYICQVSAPDTNNPMKKLEAHMDEVNAVCWSPGGRYLASCSDDSTAKIWTVESGLMFDLKGHEKEIFTLKWTPTGEGSEHHSNKPLYLCTASFDGTVKVWSGETGTLVYNLCREVQPVYSLAPSPNGNLIATGSLGGNVSIWSLFDGQLIRELQGVGDTFDVSWSADGDLLCSCFSSGLLFVLDSSADAAVMAVNESANSIAASTVSDHKGGKCASDGQADMEVTNASGNEESEEAKQKSDVDNTAESDDMSEGPEGSTGSRDELFERKDDVETENVIGVDGKTSPTDEASSNGAIDADEVGDRAELAAAKGDGEDDEESKMAVVNSSEQGLPTSKRDNASSAISSHTSEEGDAADLEEDTRSQDEDETGDQQVQNDAKPSEQGSGASIGSGAVPMEEDS